MSAARSRDQDHGREHCGDRQDREQRERRRAPRRRARPGWLAVLAPVLWLAACQGPQLDTRTFEVQYLAQHEVANLIEPYVFTDRESSPGTMSTAYGAVTVRETPDNLEKIARVLEEYDRPKPTIMLHFQVIEANGAADSDPAIADVEQELRRLFRFEGYELVAETQIAGIEGTGVRQLIGDTSTRRHFVIEGGVSEVRLGSGEPTLTMNVQLNTPDMPGILQTSVTIPAGHSVVLGTAQAPAFEGALILVVRAEIVESATDR